MEHRDGRVVAQDQSERTKYTYRENTLLPWMPPGKVAQSPQEEETRKNLQDM